MKKILISLFSVIAIAFLVNACLNAYFGWYGYGYWKKRVWASSINDAKKRGVFEKVYNYSLHLNPGYNFQLADTTFYLEKGFKYGKHGYKYTNHLKNPKYPFQVKCESSVISNKRVNFIYVKEDNKFQVFTTDYYSIFYR